MGTTIQLYNQQLNFNSKIMNLSELSYIVKEKVYLPDIVEQDTHLHKSGTGFTAICPFHEDKNPSLSLYQKEGIWYFKCYGCGVHGSAIDWIIKKYHKTYTESVFMLAKSLKIDTTGIDDDINEFISDEIPTIQKVTEPSFIPNGVISDFKSRRRGSNFFLFLSTLFDEQTILRVFDDYVIGATKEGRAVFPQIDGRYLARQAKTILYKSDGHRDKNAVPPVGSVAKYLNLPNMVQCLFGEHLLRLYPQKPVALVEAEKTAIICSCAMPQFNWIATGSKQNFNPSMLAPLSGKTISVFPDADAFKEWTIKSRKFTFAKFMVAPILQQIATPQQIEAKADIADLIVAQIQAKKAPQEPQKSEEEQLPTDKDKSQLSTNLRGLKDTYGLEEVNEPQTSLSSLEVTLYDAEGKDTGTTTSVPQSLIDTFGDSSKFYPVLKFDEKDTAYIDWQIASSEAV